LGLVWFAADDIVTGIRTIVDGKSHNSFTHEGIYNYAYNLGANGETADSIGAWGDLGLRLANAGHGAYATWRAAPAVSSLSRFSAVEVTPEALRIEGAGAEALIKNGTPGAMVMQKTENACAAACAQQLLSENGVTVSQSNLALRSIWMQGKGLDFKSLAQTMNEFHPAGWRGGFVPEEQLPLVAARGPFIARVGGKRGHAVIVDTMAVDTVHVRDPASGMKGTISLKEFLDLYSGAIFK
jgi:hypothetical protein